TVEIENVHRNIAMKKPLRKAILDGAAQIATPAFVSTLAICIVFIPVVFLTGPAAYLFTPLALAVVFAMMASYLLSRTLVPTMILYLLPAEAEHEMHADEETAQPQSRGWFARIFHPRGFHTTFNRGFDYLRNIYQDFLAWSLAHRKLTVATMLGFALASVALYPLIGRDFFP